ncbi:unnamed protein product [Tilletia controversa]|uniref:FHA domain-containing protein n=3 Tax=Tilletia TaxID=13289 RepID=A0A8X7MR49_9BASI|nr:hypothetical protein CF336_g5259 [Tilletia laevis]KAE8194284.1 hypothetical protein CF328_g4797 [Tilletia controversa]KAE8257908.1 hypothetical protein A4X03_0g4534 [Tilletia caries]KAE8197688.1 hypothetical protein CF335_g4556 [Tilletia laevis]KAE8245583.1 hypothetical protein A4X06_0g5574 [Tilletia controversa]
MSTTNALARPPFVLAERDVNAPGPRVNDASVFDECHAKDAPAPALSLQPKTCSPSKSGAIERQQKMQLGNASSASSPAFASQRPASSPTVTFSDDPHAGLLSDEDQEREGDASKNNTKRLVLFGSYTHTLIIGRSKPSGKAHASSVASTGSTDSITAMSQTDALVRAEVEALLQHSPGINAGLKSAAAAGGNASSPGTNTKHMRVCLPNDARHVSRVHALIHYSPFPSFAPNSDTANISPQKIPTSMLGSFLLRIVGQNGLFVNGERLRAETIVPLVPGRTRLGFFSDVEAMFDVKTDAMPAHIRSRALELQSRLVPRVPSTKKTSSPVKKRSKTASSSSFLNLVRAATEPSGQNLHDTENRIRKDVPSKHSPDGNSVAPTPPPTSSPSREPEGTSQELVSQALRSVDDRAVDRNNAFSPPPSSSPVIGAGDRNPLTGMRKRKHYEVVEQSEDESDFGSGDESDYAQLPQSSASNSSPAAAANRRRIAERMLASPTNADRDVQMSSSEDEGSESDSGLSSPSSLSDDSSTPSPVRRPATAFKVSTGPAMQLDSQKRMPPPAIPVRSNAIGRPASTFGGPPLNADPITVARGAYLQSAARRAVGTLAPSYDLEGLLAFSIVFHRTATMAASEAVRGVLSGNSGLMRGIVGPRLAVIDRTSDGADASREVGEGKTLRCFSFEHALADAPTVGGRKLAITSSQWTTALTKAWREQLELVLRSSSAGADAQVQTSSQSRASRGPFGAIQRAGKDSAGNPLEPWYYYIAEADPDRERAANLAACVKPIRGALKVHKPIYWKKSAYGHNDAEVGPGDDEEEGTTGVGGTSYLSRTVANDVWGTNVEWAMGANDSNTSAQGASASLETQFNGLSESLVASSRFGYSNRADGAAQPSSSFAASSSSSAASKSFGHGTPAQQFDAPEGATQRLVDRVWSETQDEEECEATWDKFGDQDWQG